MRQIRLPLRTAVILGTAIFGGSSGGTVAHAFETAGGHVIPGASQLASAVIALWIAEKLDRLIDDRENIESNASNTEADDGS
ncbi:hypothetical protein HC031_09510 [Planosporangium thailandense]|uniref:Uncharacterized protein n=1 Tax=Planosporangium thailandense TaxID=765197 RepID=A0ABX0XXR2_9ACTN|nr:hypothetical protein [Planosporangium thailandense]NJC69949.1 hypothetical protein [Planosporangium thailandense]